MVRGYRGLQCLPWIGLALGRIRHKGECYGLYWPTADDARIALTMDVSGGSSLQKRSFFITGQRVEEHFAN